MLDRFLTVVSLFTLYDTDILSAIAFYGGSPLLFKSKKVGKISTRLSCKGEKKKACNHVPNGGCSFLASNCTILCFFYWILGISVSRQWQAFRVATETQLMLRGSDLTR